jgi:CRP/FNR family cyclic AMP-dependent transcriptional regulator
MAIQSWLVTILWETPGREKGCHPLFPADLIAVTAAGSASRRSPDTARRGRPPAGTAGALSSCLRMSYPEGGNRMPGAHPMMDGIADRRSYGEGDLIFREGMRGDGFYLIEKGQVEIYKLAPDGQKIVIGKIVTGGIFGEMSAIDDEPRMANAAALEPTVCRIIPPSVLKKKIASSDRLVQAIIRVFMNNIREITKRKITQAFAEAGVEQAKE